MRPEIENLVAAEQLDFPSFLQVSQVVNALRVLRQIQNFLGITVHSSSPLAVFVIPENTINPFFRQFAKVLCKVVKIKIE